MYYQVPTQRGRRFIVTGSNSGTGRETARRLALAGAEVILAVRSPEKGEAARAEILRDAPGAAIPVRRLDLADLSSVRAFAAGIIEDKKPLHALVNNAGVMAPPKRYETVDGFELQFGTNFLGPFALTNLLLPLLLEQPHVIVATMSSGTANFGKLDFTDLNWTRRRFSPVRAYAASKLADLLFGRHLAAVAGERRWDLKSTLAHPGFTRTNLQTAGKNLGRSTDAQLKPIRNSGIGPSGISLWTLLPSQGVEVGSEPLLYAATAPEAEQGAYYGPRWWAMVGRTHRASIPRSGRSMELAARLWSEAERLTGTSLP